MKKLLFSLLITLIWMIQGVIAQTPSGVLSLDPSVKVGKLDNGLTYFIKYNNKPERKVELRLAVNAGSILEDDDQQGLAHFMEHMNFNGLQNFPDNELVHYLQSIGVGFGNDLNAYTGFDETVYILPVPSDDPVKLEKAFTVLADWSHQALLTPAEIDKERGVILEESRMGKGADDRMMKKWLPELMNGSRYSVRLPIGKDSIIANFDHSALKRFYTDWYRPSLQAVIVVGDMPVEEAEKMIVQKFGGFRDPVPPRDRPITFPMKPVTVNKAMVLSDDEANRTSISITGSTHPRTPVTTEAGYHEQNIKMLFSNMLWSRLNELQNSANPPFIYAYAYIGGGWARGYEQFNAVAMCSANGIKKAVDALVTESMRAKKHGFTEAELQRAKAAVLSDFEQRYMERNKTESENYVYRLVNYYLEGDVYPGIDWEYDYIKKNLDGITLKDFDGIRSKMDIDQHFFAYITSKTNPDLPTNDQLKTWIESALATDVAPYQEARIAATLLDKEPVPGKIVKTEKNEKLGTITYTLSNKAVVCIRPTDFKNDEVLLKSSRFGGYSLYQGADYQSAQWCNNLQDDMGYGNFSKTDLDKFLSGKIASINPEVVEYTESMIGNSSNKDMETMFQLLYLKSTAPRKDEAAFQSFITRSKQQLESLKQDPQYLFMDTAYNTFYQYNKRAHMIESPADYDQINVDHSIAFYRERLCNPSGMYYTIVGSFTEEQIRPLIEKYIGGLNAAPVNTQYKDLGIFPKTGKNSFTLHKGTEAQAMLVHYITGKMAFNAEDNFKLGMLNRIINNMIIDTIREQMSAIYGGGCGGSLQKYPREEYLIRTTFPCSPENVENVHAAFFRLLEKVQSEGGITEKDLTQAREPALEQNKVSLKQNDYWLQNLQASFLNETDPERILTREKRLKDITTAQLMETARKFYGNPSVFKAIWLPEK